MKTVHYPVLCAEVVESLKGNEGGTFVDCTMGGAGHTEAILKSNDKNTVVAIDRDARAHERAKVKLEPFNGRVTFVQGNFSEVKTLASGETFDGMLVDLGLSTDQLKENRGFSFKDQSPLDMRMDESQSFSAADVVNSYSEKDLIRVLKRGGVGSEASAVTRAILRERPIATTEKLSSVINKAAAGLTAKKKINPSTVIFQAIRIEVNKEFEEIDRMLDSAPEVVKPGGRLAVITFHSLEDQLVTHRMRDWQDGDTRPASWPGPRVPSKGRLVSQKPIVPSEKELSENPASRSARLRVFEFSSVSSEVTKWQ